jgi:FlaA1/EpsC-like NDP-sugar epimerase
MSLARSSFYRATSFEQYEMQQCFNGREMRYFLGDVRDVERLKRGVS